ncbi:MAG: hypothetical protein AB7O26_21085, partial [Planctomycetaceae bacterium]
MPLSRLNWWLLGAALACFGLVVAATGRSQPANSAIEPAEGVPYAVEIHSERSTFDLSFDAGTRYFVAVSSLGTAAQTYTVSLESQAVPEAVLTPFHPVRPLNVPADTRGIVSVSPNPSGTVISPTPLESGSFRSAGSQEGSSSPGPRSRTFHLHAADGSLDDEKQYAAVAADLVAEGERVRLYLDRQERKSQLVPGVVDEIIRLFDHDVIPCESRLLGNFRDVDGDGKFSVLLSPWLDRLQGGRTSLGGFVRGSDFRSDVERPFSNRCDMMYLNTNVRPGPHLKSLLAHEYAHAVSFSERLSQPCGEDQPDEEDWLNEAIAHCAENICNAGWSNLDYRVSRYLTDTNQYALVVPDYYRAGLWRDHGCRGATYLFLRWCVDQFGEGLLPALVRSSDRGIENLERATGHRFDDLYRLWTLALITPRAVARDSLCRSQAAYRSIDPYGRLTTWGLVGPRAVPCPPSGSQSITLKGTSTAFVELSGAGERGVRRIQLSAEPGTMLQVSLIRSVVDETPRAEARWISAGDESAGPGKTLLEVRLDGLRGARGGVSMIGCE